jgi:RNA polymerase sigma-70 factor (ECF subfamily)
MRKNREKKALDQADYGPIIKRILAGETALFEELMTDHQDMIFNCCCRILGDYDDACDAAQDSFIKAFRHLSGFRHESGFTTWLYRIAVNTCNSRLRSISAVRKKTVSMNSVNILPAGKRGDPANDIEQQERDSIIQNAISILPKKLRTLVVLRDIEQKSYSEISIITGMKIGTIKSRLNRARRELRPVLEGALRDEM